MLNKFPLLSVIYRCPNTSDICLLSCFQMWEVASGLLLVTVVFDHAILSVSMDNSEQALFAGATDGKIYQTNILAQVQSAVIVLLGVVVVVSSSSSSSSSSSGNSSSSDSQCSSGSSTTCSSCGTVLYMFL